MAAAKASLLAEQEEILENLQSEFEESKKENARMLAIFQQKHEEEMDDLRAELLQSHEKETHKRVAKHLKELRLLTDESETREREMEILEAKISTYEGLLDRKDKEHRVELEAKISMMQDEIDDLNMELKASQAEAACAVTHAKELRDGQESEEKEQGPEFFSLITRYSDLSQEYRELQEQNHRLEEELQNARATATVSNTDDSEKSAGIILSLKDELSEAKLDAATAKAELSQRTTELADLLRDCETLREVQVKLADEASDARKRLAELTKGSSGDSDLDELRERVTVLANDLTTTHKLLDAARGQLEDARQENAELQATADEQDTSLEVSDELKLAEENLSFAREEITRLGTENVLQGERRAALEEQLTSEAHEVQALKSMLEPLKKLSSEQTERIRDLESKQAEYDQKDMVIQEETTRTGSVTNENFEQIAAERDAKAAQVTELEERLATIEAQAEEAEILKSELSSLQEQLQTVQCNHFQFSTFEFESRFHIFVFKFSCRSTRHFMFFLNFQ